MGLEGDFIYFTESGLVLSGAFSFLDTEITESLVPTNDVVVGQELAFAPGIQANVSARKEWGMKAAIQVIGKLKLPHQIEAIRTSWHLIELSKTVIVN